MEEREDDYQQSADRGAPRRKGPVVNRRGPSEVSRAIQMMSNLSGRAPTGKKPVAGRVARGTVVRIDRAKGYGFIVDSSGEQRFFHRSAVSDGGFDALEEQQSVDFEPLADERGARAQKVRPAGTVVRDQAPARSPKAAPKAPAWKSDLSPFRSGFGAPARGKRPKI